MCFPNTNVCLINKGQPTFGCFSVSVLRIQKKQFGIRLLALLAVTAHPCACFPRGFAVSGFFLLLPLLPGLSVPLVRMLPPPWGDSHTCCGTVRGGAAAPRVPVPRRCAVGRGTAAASETKPVFHENSKQKPACPLPPFISRVLLCTWWSRPQVPLPIRRPRGGGVTRVSLGLHHPSTSPRGLPTSHSHQVWDKSLGD